jgi:hypothetical protein
VKGSGSGRDVHEVEFSSREFLPQSPPRIISSMLEDPLCFTPKPWQRHERSVGVDLATTPRLVWENVGGRGVVGEVPTPTPTSRSGEARNFGGTGRV